MPTLRPFRDYDEKDVINLFAVSGSAIPINKGTLVTVAQSGFNTQTTNINLMLGDFGGFNEPNTISQRYGIPYVVTVAGTGDIPLGMTLFDVREVDENGELLKFNPRKAAEMEAVISGQAMPIVTRGMFLYSGITGSPAINAPLYVGPNGVMDDFATSSTTGGVTQYYQARVGKVIGKKDDKGFALIKLEL